MLLYEYKVREEFKRFREYAENVRAKFEAGAEAAHLLLDANSLRSHYERLDQMLPAPVRGKSDLARHLRFMDLYLRKQDINSCRCDIVAICDYDLPELEGAFQDWCKSPDHYDAELAAAIADLLAHWQLAAAIQRAFVVLKERLCKRFGASSDLDGAPLVNAIFGGAGLAKTLSASERQALRDLLAGMYSVFRNRFAHSTAEPTFAEADAIISMVNHVLHEIGRIG